MDGSRAPRIRARRRHEGAKSASITPLEHRVSKFFNASGKRECSPPAAGDERMCPIAENAAIQRVSGEKPGDEAERQKRPAPRRLNKKNFNCRECQPRHG